MTLYDNVIDFLTIKVFRESADMTVLYGDTRMLLRKWHTGCQTQRVTRPTLTHSGCCGRQTTIICLGWGFSSDKHRVLYGTGAQIRYDINLLVFPLTSIDLHQSSDPASRFVLNDVGEVSRVLPVYCWRWAMSSAIHQWAMYSGSQWCVNANSAGKKNCI